MQLFTQNSDLKRTGIFAWTLPAHIVHLADGTRINVCPNAGICAGLCYAKAGRWLFSNVRKAHLAKLEMILADLGAWQSTITQELSKAKYQGKFIRIHDGGDYFTQAYAMAWAEIALDHPGITFYSYTKEVSMFKHLYGLALIPDNMILIYSMGGREDHLVDKELDRHCEVFATQEAMDLAGYSSVEADDKLAAIQPSHKVGLLANNIPHLKRKQGSYSFSEIQEGKRA